MERKRDTPKRPNKTEGWRRLWIPLLALLVSVGSAFGQAPDKSQPEPVVQTGHGDVIMGVAFSLDGKYMASGSKDRTIKIWEVATGVELRTLYGHRNTVRRVVFSPDGTTLASAGTGDGTVRLWRVETGEQVQVLKEKTEWPLPDEKMSDRPDQEYYESVTSVAFSPRGDVVASCNYKAIKLWDVKTGRRLGTFLNHTDWIHSIAFNSDGTQILSAGSDKKIKISDTKTGKVLKVFEDKSIDEKDFYRVNSAIFSPDEKTVISTDSGGKVKIWDVAGARLLRAFEVDKPPAKPAPQEKSNSDGKEEPFKITVAEDNDTDLTSAVLLNASTLITGGGGGTITSWNLSDGRKRPLTGHTKVVEDVAFSPKNNLLASCSSDKTIRLWDVAGWKEVKTLRGRTSRVTSASFAHRAPYLVVGFNDSIIKLWSLEKGDCRTLNARAQSAPNPAYEFGNGLIDYNYGGLITTVFSPDDRVLATGNRDIKLWEMASGRLLWTIPTEEVTVNTLAFSPNGERLASNSLPLGVIRLWDTSTGGKIRDFTGHKSPVDLITFTPDGKTLASADRNKIIKLWDVDSGKELTSFAEHKDSLTFMFFSSDGGKLVSHSKDGEVMIWDTAGRQKITSFSASDPDAGEKLLRIVPRAKLDDASVHERRFTLAADGAGSIYLSDKQSGKLLIRLYRLDNEWGVVTPEGFFDGTPSLWKQLIWRFNNNTFDYGSAELYFNDFFYPNLLQNVMAGKSPKPIEGQELEKIDRRQPKVEIAAIDGQTRAQFNRLTASRTPTDARVVTVTVEVTDNDGEKKRPEQSLTSGAQELRLFRNGLMVKAWHGDAFESGKTEGCQQVGGAGLPRRVRCRTGVSIVAGENTFTAYAFNSSDVKSNDDSVTIKGAESLKRGGTLYVLAVGINRYANPNYNLNFAVPDVRDIGASLRAEQEKLASDAGPNRYARTEVVTLTDEDATKENILLALRRFSEGEDARVPGGASERLKAELARIKPTQPEDALIIYYAGHGTSHGPRFYLLPHDFAGRDHIEARGVSDLELNEVLEKVDSERLLLVIDACQSGQALGGANEGRAPMNSKGLAQLAYDKGMLILTAAQSQQAALEAVRIGGKEIRHGLLTYALLQSLTDKGADKDSDGRLREREWLDYAVEQVPLLQVEAMTQRHVAIEKTGTGREIVYLEGDDTSANPADRRVQTPRVFYRREAELHPMIVAKY